MPFQQLKRFAEKPGNASVAQRLARCGADDPSVWHLWCEHICLGRKRTDSRGAGLSWSNSSDRACPLEVSRMTVDTKTSNYENLYTYFIFCTCKFEIFFTSVLFWCSHLSSLFYSHLYEKNTGDCRNVERGSAVWFKFEKGKALVYVFKKQLLG